MAVKPENVAAVMYIVGFLDLFGVSMVVPLLSKHARELGANPALIGLVGSVYGGLQLFSSPLVGRWSDVSGRRHVLLWCLLLSASGYLCLGASNTILLLILARIPPGLFKHTAELARGYLADITDERDHSLVFGRFNAASSMGFIVGPTLGGHLAELPGGFLLVAILTVATFLLNLGLFKHTSSLAKIYIADTVTPGQRSQVQGRYNAFSSMGFIIGPTVGGHLADTSGGFCVIASLATAAFLLNSAIVWFFIPEPRLTVAKTKAEEGEGDEKETAAAAAAANAATKTSEGFHPLHFLEAFKEIDWTHIWDIFLVRFLMGFAVLVYRNNFTLMLDYKYHASVKVAGYLTSYSAIVGTLSGFFIGRIAALYKKDDSRLLLHSALVQFVSIVALTFSPSLWMLLLCLTPLSLANQVARVAAVNLTIERGQGQEKGTLLGLGASVLSVARMLSPVLGGVAQELHVSGPCIVGAIFAGLGALTLSIVPQKTKFKAKNA